MKKTISGVAILLALFLPGCFFNGVFDPPPPEYRMWAKGGASYEDIKIALLECGYPDPMNSGKYRRSDDEIITSGLCMQADGFSYVSDRNRNSALCPNDINSRPSACDLNVQAPARSAQRRLGSPFCQEFPRAMACQ